MSVCRVDCLIDCVNTYGCVAFYYDIIVAVVVVVPVVVGVIYMFAALQCLTAFAYCCCTFQRAKQLLPLTVIVVATNILPCTCIYKYIYGMYLMYIYMVAYVYVHMYVCTYNMFVAMPLWPLMTCICERTYIQTHIHAMTTMTRTNGWTSRNYFRI